MSHIMMSRDRFIFVAVSTFLLLLLCPMNDAFSKFRLTTTTTSSLYPNRGRNSFSNSDQKSQTYYQNTRRSQLPDLVTRREHQNNNEAVICLDDEPPPEQNSKFGRQDYWNQVYKKEANFSWYAGWKDELQPFVDELLLNTDDDYDDDNVENININDNNNNNNNNNSKKASINILIPGVGNDATLVDMFDDGYTYLTAMDYAPEGIERCRDMLGPNRIINSEEERKNGTTGGVRLVVADARNLTNVFHNHEFDAVIEKGTLDAIFLSGGNDKEKSLRNLQTAISELGRCLKPGGTWISIAAVVVDQIQDSFDSITATNNNDDDNNNENDDWTCLVDKDDLYVTEDGYTSNNIDGNLLVWKKGK